MTGDEEGIPQPNEQSSLDVDPLLRQVCVCPACQGELLWSQAAVDCKRCQHHYRREQGIPLFAAPHMTGSRRRFESKQKQVNFFDTLPSDWETERPHGAPTLYGWLMAEKFRRSISGLEAMLPDATVLTVCGGSGMDAEFLVRAGANVIVSDLSFGAVLRARNRAVRHGLRIIPVVADAEALPFRTASVDIAYVHDGLHHLEDSRAALMEMARVARGGVSLTEPAQAAVTAAAVRLGLALKDEEAGNRVARLDPRWVEEQLRASGLQIIGVDRYAMYYRHEPGAAMRMFSRPRLSPLAKATIIGGNRLVGRVGNKLSARAASNNSRSTQT